MVAEKRAPESVTDIAPPTKKKKKSKTSEEVPVKVVEEVQSEKKKKKKDKKEKKEEAVAEVAPVTEEKEKKKKKGKKEKSDDSDTTVAPAKKTEEKKQAAPAKTDDGKDHKSNPFYSEHNITVSGAPTPLPAVSFSSSGLPKEISEYLEKKFAGGKPSPIQAVAWPLILQGLDVFGIAKTGSGKSLAFVLPYIAKRLSMKETEKKSKKQYPRMVCMAPTKELVQQIAEVCEEFCKKMSIDLNVHTIIGGVPKYEQINKIKREHCDMVIATPGRLLDLVENDQVINLTKCEYLVLDEADRMLDDGFILSIRKIAEYCENPNGRQTVLFSATWPLEVNKLARGLIKNIHKPEPATITVLRKGEVIDDPDNINTEDKLQLNDAIKQELHVLQDHRRKWDLLSKALKDHSGQKIIVFGLYKKEVENLEQWMQGAGHKVVALQGNMTQDKRTAAIESFKKNKVQILVATDVAGRGLDIPDIELVINYTFPLTVEDFVHRCGRTGRAGKKGKAITFFNEAGDHKEKEHCFDIIRLLEGAKQPVPEALRKLNANTYVATKKKSHGMYGNFFKSEEEMAKLSQKKVQMAFDSDSD